jgi:hypothetical protein
MLSACYRDETWSWGGRGGSNSISDAEQLLCLLYPATEIDAFALESPDDIADDVRAALEPLGEDAQIGAKIVAVLEDFIARHSNEKGDPVFGGGSYLRTSSDAVVSDEQRALEVVDSYSMSLTLCLAALRFLRGFQRHLRGQSRKPYRALSDRIDVLDQRIGVRLTAAMTGLVRSFVVNTVPRRSSPGRSIVRMLNQDGDRDDVVADGITRRLIPVRRRLRDDVTLGQTPDTALEDETQLFECGWGWGIIDGASAVDILDMPIAHQKGYADGRPYLYFTVVALDGITDLTAQRNRDLLDTDQRRLAEALLTRGDLTQRYWSTAARYGTRRWPLEDIPWRTSDGAESDYYSLIVSAVLMQDLVTRQATDEDLTRAVAVFEELARRGRITTRVTFDDPAVKMHSPGVTLTLDGSEKAGGGIRLEWVVYDFAAVLLKRALQAARLSQNVAARDRLMALAERIMDHLDLRTVRKGRYTGLWDDPTRAFDLQSPEIPDASWYMTERVMECLLVADGTFRQPPLRTAAMVDRTLELLNEADHLLNQEMLDVSDEDASAHSDALKQIERRLTRARGLVPERPGTAFSLTTEALIQLDQLTFARLDATRGS